MRPGGRWSGPHSTARPRSGDLPRYHGRLRRPGRWRDGGATEVRWTTGDSCAGRPSWRPPSSTASSERPVGGPVDLAALRAAMGGPLPEDGEDPIAVVEGLARDADPGIVATAGPRYFGFVIGGSQPAALAADWLTSTWDQNAAAYVISPAAAVAEEVAHGWLLDLLGLPAGTSVGFTTGATMANFTALAAARHAVLREVGWDVEVRGLFDAPAIHVVLGDEAHVTVFVSLQMLGLGRDRVHRVAADEQGRMRPDALRATLAGLDGPTIVVAQAGNVNTGAFDPLPEIVGGGARARRLAPRRRRVRPVGRGRPGAARSDRGSRAGRFVDDRRPQVAQRAVRLRARVRPRRGRPSDVDDPRRVVLHRDRWGRTGPVQLGGRVLPTRPRVHGLRRASLVRAGPGWPRSSSAAAPMPGGSRSCSPDSPA